MIDQTLSAGKVLMRHEDIARVPETPLPTGYRFAMLRACYDDARAWAALEFEAGLFVSFEDAMKAFGRSFGMLTPEARRRVLFVETDAGEKVGSAAAWFGDLNGVAHPILHYVAIAPKHQGRGLARPMLGRALGLLRAYGESKDVLLISSPRSYQAIGIYLSLGFRPYSERDCDVFNCVNRIAFDPALWAIIKEKLAQAKLRQPDR